MRNAVYPGMDITNHAEVSRVLNGGSRMLSFTVRRGRMWTLRRNRRTHPKSAPSTRREPDTLHAHAKPRRENGLYQHGLCFQRAKVKAVWQPDCKANTTLNVYGQTKLEGEWANGNAEKYFIIRIAWGFGLNGKNFIRTMLNMGEKMIRCRWFAIKSGTPTYTLDLARLLADMIETEKYGYYHATTEGGYISWNEFACEIFRQAGMDVTVVPVTTAEYGVSKAARPFNSRLDKMFDSMVLSPFRIGRMLSRYLQALKKS